MNDETILRIALSDGRHVDVPLGWLRAQLAPQGLHIVRTPATLVLQALDGASHREIRKEAERDDWRGQVAQAVVTHRLDEYAWADERERAALDASHKSGACAPEPRPTRPKPRS